MCYSTLSEDQGLLACSKSLTTTVTIPPDLGCGCLVLRTSRWSIEVDSLHPDRRSESSSILMLFLLDLEV